MREFGKWVKSHPEKHPVQFAALIHFKIVYIHPFEHANGRTARVLMNFFLHKAGYPMVKIDILYKKN
jgi:Fic family protein